MTTAEHSSTGEPMSTRVLELMGSDLRSLPVIIGVVVLGLFFTTQSSTFLTPRNLANLAEQVSVTGIIALGVVFVLLIAEIDLSVAAISGLGAVLMAKLIVEFGFSSPVAVVAAILLGMIVGVVNGRWTTYFLVPSFVVTLGVGLVLNGTQLLALPQTGRYSLIDTNITLIAQTDVSGVYAWVLAIVAIGVYAFIRYSTYQSKVEHGVERSMSKDLLIPVVIMAVVSVGTVVYLSNQGGIPTPFVIFLAVLAVAGYVVNETSFGIHLYAVGGNVDAARRMGINVDRVKITSFALAGGLAALSGIIAASRILGVSTSSGGGIGGGALLLNSIAAAVIGGVSLFGGEGRVSAALLGALIVGMVSNGLNLMGVGSEIRLIVTGGLLVLAVSIDRSIERATSDG